MSAVLREPRSDPFPARRRQLLEERPTWTSPLACPNGRARFAGYAASRSQARQPRRECGPVAAALRGLPGLYTVSMRSQQETRILVRRAHPTNSGARSAAYGDSCGDDVTCT